MASERKQQANRNNAMRSTGPRTERGKLRAKLNTLRHGLATKQAALPEIERMAKAICGRGAVDCNTRRLSTLPRINSCF